MATTVLPNAGDWGTIPTRITSRCKKYKKNLPYDKSFLQKFNNSLYFRASRWDSTLKTTLKEVITHSIQNNEKFSELSEKKGIESTDSINLSTASQNVHIVRNTNKANTLDKSEFFSENIDAKVYSREAENNSTFEKNQKESQVIQTSKELPNENTSSNDTTVLNNLRTSPEVNFEGKQQKPTAEDSASKVNSILPDLSSTLPCIETEESSSFPHDSLPAINDIDKEIGENGTDNFFCEDDRITLPYDSDRDDEIDIEPTIENSDNYTSESSEQVQGCQSSPCLLNKAVDKTSKECISHADESFAFLTKLLEPIKNKSININENSVNADHYQNSLLEIKEVLSEHRYKEPSTKVKGTERNQYFANSEVIKNILRQNIIEKGKSLEQQTPVQNKISQPVIKDGSEHRNSVNSEVLPVVDSKLQGSSVKQSFPLENCKPKQPSEVIKHILRQNITEKETSLEQQATVQNKRLQPVIKDGSEHRNSVNSEVLPVVGSKLEGSSVKQSFPPESCKPKQPSTSLKNSYDLVGKIMMDMDVVMPVVNKKSVLHEINSCHEQKSLCPCVSLVQLQSTDDANKAFNNSFSAEKELSSNMLSLEKRYKGFKNLSNHQDVQKNITSGKTQNPTNLSNDSMPKTSCKNFKENNITRIYEKNFNTTLPSLEGSESNEILEKSHKKSVGKESSWIRCFNCKASSSGCNEEQLCVKCRHRNKWLKCMKVDRYYTKRNTPRWRVAEEHNVNNSSNVTNPKILFADSQKKFPKHLNNSNSENKLLSNFFSRKEKYGGKAQHCFKLVLQRVNDGTSIRNDISINSKKHNQKDKTLNGQAKKGMKKAKIVSVKKNLAKSENLTLVKFNERKNGKMLKKSKVHKHRSKSRKIKKAVKINIEKISDMQQECVLSLSEKFIGNYEDANHLRDGDHSLNSDTTKDLALEIVEKPSKYLSTKFLGSESEEGMSEEIKKTSTQITGPLETMANLSSDKNATNGVSSMEDNSDVVIINEVSGKKKNIIEITLSDDESSSSDFREQACVELIDLHTDVSKKISNAPEDDKQSRYSENGLVSDLSNTFFNSFHPRENGKNSQDCLNALASKESSFQISSSQLCNSPKLDETLQLHFSSNQEDILSKEYCSQQIKDTKEVCTKSSEIASEFYRLVSIRLNAKRSLMKQSFSEDNFSEYTFNENLSYYENRKNPTSRVSPPVTLSKSKITTPEQNENSSHVVASNCHPVVDEKQMKSCCNVSFKTANSISEKLKVEPEYCINQNDSLSVTSVEEKQFKLGSSNNILPSTVSDGKQIKTSSNFVSYGVPFLNIEAVYSLATFNSVEEQTEIPNNRSDLITDSDSFSVDTKELDNVTNGESLSTITSSVCRKSKQTDSDDNSLFATTISKPTNEMKSSNKLDLEALVNIIKEIKNFPEMSGNHSQQDQASNVVSLAIKNACNDLDAVARASILDISQNELRNVQSLPKTDLITLCKLWKAGREFLYSTENEIHEQLRALSFASNSKEQRIGSTHEAAKLPSSVVKDSDKLLQLCLQRTMAKSTLEAVKKCAQQFYFPTTRNEIQSQFARGESSLGSEKRENVLDVISMLKTLGMNVHEHCVKNTKTSITNHDLQNLYNGNIPTTSDSSANIRSKRVHPLTDLVDRSNKKLCAVLPNRHVSLEDCALNKDALFFDGHDLNYNLNGAQNFSNSAATLKLKTLQHMHEQSSSRVRGSMANAKLSPVAQVQHLLRQKVKNNMLEKYYKHTNRYATSCPEKTVQTNVCATTSSVFSGNSSCTAVQQNAVHVTEVSTSVTGTTIRSPQLNNSASCFPVFTNHSSEQFFRWHQPQGLPALYVHPGEFHLKDQSMINHGYKRLPIRNQTLETSVNHHYTDKWQQNNIQISGEPLTGRQTFEQIPANQNFPGFICMECSKPISDGIARWCAACLEIPYCSDKCGEANWYKRHVRTCHRKYLKELFQQLI